jgi:hypothetical protein
MLQLHALAERESQKEEKSGRDTDASNRTHGQWKKESRRGTGAQALHFSSRPASRARSAEQVLSHYESITAGASASADSIEANRKEVDGHHSPTEWFCDKYDGKVGDALAHRRYHSVGTGNGRTTPSLVGWIWIHRAGKAFGRSL